MSGHVFQCTSETADLKQFSVTLEKLSHYVSKTFKSTSNLYPIFNNFTTPVIAKSAKPELLSDAVDVAIFNEEIKDYVKNVTI